MDLWLCAKEGGAACYSRLTISQKLLNKLAILPIEKKKILLAY